MAVTYLFFGFGVTVGYHRLLTHRSFQTHQRPASTCGPCSARWACRARSSTGSPTTASTTRTPTRRAIRTPRTSATAQGAARASGTRTPAGCSRRTARPTGRSTPASSTRTRACAASAGVPVAGVTSASRSRPRSASSLHGFTLEGALRGLVWGGLVRAFFLHHVTWSINSVCHFFGRRRFDDRGSLDQRRLARAALARRGVAPQPPRVPALGRARPAPLGDRRLRRCSSAAMEKVGLAWNVVRIAPERQAAKMVGAGGARGSLDGRCRSPDALSSRAARPRDPVA